MLLLHTVYCHTSWPPSHTGTPIIRNVSIQHAPTTNTVSHRWEHTFVHRTFAVIVRRATTHRAHLFFVRRRWFWVGSQTLCKQFINSDAGWPSDLCKHLALAHRRTGEPKTANEAAQLWSRLLTVQSASRSGWKRRRTSGGSACGIWFSSASADCWVLVSVFFSACNLWIVVTWAYKTIKAVYAHIF